MRTTTTVKFEKQAPKSRAFGVRTDEGVLIKIWVPNDLISKNVDEFEVEFSLPSKGKKTKPSKATGKKRRAKEEEDEDEEEEDDEDEDDSDDDEDEN